jgi:hypothetical protein
MSSGLPKGRPSVYSAELAERICLELSQGKTLREVCRGEGMPSESVIRNWVLDNREGFAAQYAQARETGYQAMADEIIEIADDSSQDTIIDPVSGATKTNSEFVNRSRLRVDTRKWLLAKALPKIYGDKVHTELTGKDGGPIQTEDLSDPEVARRIAFVLQKGVQPEKPTEH